MVRDLISDRFLEQAFRWLMDKLSGDRPGDGILVRIEGLDGVGKGTQAEALRALFRMCGLVEGKSFILTREPGGPPLPERIRVILLEKPTEEQPMAPETEALLFAAARVETNRFIKTGIEDGKLVVAFRGFESSFSYQAFGRGLLRWWIYAINLFGVSRADLKIYIRVPAEEACRRVRGRGHADRIESEDLLFYQRLEAGYDALIEAEGDWEEVDGTKSPEEVAAAIKALIVRRVPHIFAEQVI